MKGIVVCLFGLLLVSAQASGSGYSDSASPIPQTVEQANKQMVHSNQKLLRQLENVQVTFDKIERDQSKANKALAIRLKEEATLSAKVSDLKAIKDKMAAVTEDFDAWAAPQTTKVEKLKADIVVLKAEIESLKKKQASFKARTEKAKEEIPKVQSQVDALKAEIRAKGAHSLTGSVVSEDALQASESDDDTATTLLKSEHKADKEAAEEAKPTPKSPTASKKAKASAQPAVPIMAKVNATGSMKSSDQPCCVAHKGPLCLNTAVAECVCKVRSSCCTKNWDITCVDAVVEQGCGSCNSAALTASPLLNGVVQIGGRTKDQVYLK
jgi:hypothetical protein